MLLRITGALHVKTWIDDTDGGFGVLTTESCEEITVGGVPIEGVVPLRAGDRVRIDCTSATECTISKLVRFD